jgi:hypothetical protein
MGWFVKRVKDDNPLASPKGSKSDRSSGDDIDEKKADSLSVVEEVTVRDRWKQRAVRLGHRLNPFYVDDPPPVPDGDAGLVPEFTANWFEKLTFGWLAPLMFVRSPEILAPIRIITRLERLSTATAKGRFVALGRCAAYRQSRGQAAKEH